MLIACANVAVLFTVRATHRQREIAVRKALGASAGRIARALAAEAVVLGTVATAIGLALAQGIISTAGPLLERNLGRSAPGGVSALAIDGAILAGALLTGLFVIVVCCAAQFWTTARAPLTQALTGGQKGASAGPQQRRAHAILIAFEVAACLTLLVGAALMMQSGLRILAVDMGLQTRDVVVGRLSLSQGKYPDAARRNAFYDRVVAGVQTIAGPRGVAFANAWPLQQAPSRDVGRDEPQVPLSARAGLVAVSPGYFDTLSIALDEGRAFTSGDTPGTERVAIVSRTLAARLWPGRRAVGQRLRVGPSQNAAPTRAAHVVSRGRRRRGRAPCAYRQRSGGRVSRVRAVSVAGAIHVRARLGRPAANRARPARPARHARSRHGAGDAAAAVRHPRPAARRAHGSWRRSSACSRSSRRCWRCSASTASSPTR